MAKEITPRWRDINASLADLDRAGRIGLVQGLYVAGKDTPAFLHARFALGDDVLKRYKTTPRCFGCRMRIPLKMTADSGRT